MPSTNISQLGQLAHRYNRYVRGERGIKQIPGHEFWSFVAARIASLPDDVSAFVSDLTALCPCSSPFSFAYLLRTALVTSPCLPIHAYISTHLRTHLSTHLNTHERSTQRISFRRQVAARRNGGRSDSVPLSRLNQHTINDMGASFIGVLDVLVVVFCV